MGKKSIKKRGRKRGKKAKLDRDELTIKVSGRPAQILQKIYELSHGRRSYTDILDEWSKHIESPNEKLIIAINELESVCKTYFNPDTTGMVELLRPVIIQSTNGNYDAKAFRKVVLDYIESQKSKACDVE